MMVTSHGVVITMTVFEQVCCEMWANVLADEKLVSQKKTMHNKTDRIRTRMCVADFHVEDRDKREFGYRKCQTQNSEQC